MTYDTYIHTYIHTYLHTRRMQHIVGRAFMSCYYLLHQQYRCQHVARCQLHIQCMQCLLPRTSTNCALYNALSIYTVLLTRSLAHCSCSWPTQLDQAVLAACTCSSSPIASAKLKLSLNVVAMTLSKIEAVQ